MVKLIVLGSSYAIPDQTHENTHFALVGTERLVLIDGPGNPQVRLAKAGLYLDQITDIILTHFHPDHVSGIPLLMMGMGLSRRTKDLKIYGNQHCLDLVRQTLESYQWTSWHSFQTDFIVLPDRELEPVLSTEEFSIFASPVKHFIPTIGLRIEFPKFGKVVAYSCDTAPTPSLFPLAQNADLLIHEAAGASIGHSSAAQAGEVARKADVKQLCLIHYPTGSFDYHYLAEEAAREYNGPIIIAEDFTEFEF